MAHKKQGGKLTQRKRTNPKYLGVKVTHGQRVNAGSILIRQRGTKTSPGKGVRVGRDHSLYAENEGQVKFGKKHSKKIVSVIS